MFQLISKPLIVAVLVAVQQPPVPQPEYQVCHEYYLKMRNIEVRSLEYVVQRNKTLEMTCGAFRRLESEE